MHSPLAHCCLAGFVVFLMNGPAVAQETAPTAVERFDIVIYGGTSAGVAAAVQAQQMGKSVLLVSPDSHLGGLSAGGLGWTDSGDKAAVGGIAREFYHRVWEHYQLPAAWQWQTPDQYGNRGQGAPAIDGAARTMWVFEPHVAEAIFESLIAKQKIRLVRDEWLDRESGVSIKDNRIQSITTLSGRTYFGRMFIDATYEGDLMAAAGVSYTVGREANTVYDETLNGVQTQHATKHQFDVPIDPYNIPGDATSGLLPNIHAGGPGVEGSGDERIQAYCFRMCLSDVPDNRVAFPKPHNYDPINYELLARYLDAGWREGWQKFDPLPNRKTDTNNHGAFSTDFVGMNYDYPNASYERRREIVQAHVDYPQGLMWFLANDPRAPADVRQRMSQWGLAKDEFTDNGNWPHQLYIREARRMVSDYVQTEHDCRRTRVCADSVGLGSYNMDSHNVQRYVDAAGHARNEGDIQVSPGGTYAISYRALVPPRGERENLLVPVCLSSSHIAYGSIRMEPVFMVLGQSAATAAALAIDEQVPVQDVPYDVLRARLIADGQQLDPHGTAAAAAGIPPASLPGVVVDDEQATCAGNWTLSRSVSPFIGTGYRHNGNASANGGTVASSARFTATLTPGRYTVRLAYTAHENRAAQVPVTIRHAQGATELEVDQRQPPGRDRLWKTLGIYDCDGTTIVEVGTRGAVGFVIVDAVQFLPEQ